LVASRYGNDATRINSINQGPSSDTIVVSRVGNSIIVNVDIGVDVPGFGPGLTVNDQQDAFVSVFDVSDVQDVRIEGLGGDDQISLIGIFDFLDTLEVFGGYLILSLVHPLSDGMSVSLYGDEGEDIIIGDDGSFAPLLVRPTIGGNDMIQAGTGDDPAFVRMRWSRLRRFLQQNGHDGK
jgi:hypothetical protein